MTSYELADLYNEILGKLEELESYTKEISYFSKEISNQSDSLIDLVIKKGADQNTLPTINNIRNTIINNISSFLMNFNLLANHAKLLEIQKEYSKLASMEKYKSFAIELATIENLFKQYSQMTDMIYQYVKTKNVELLPDMLNRMKISGTFYYSIVETYQKLISINSKIENQLPQNGENTFKELCLHFYNDELDLDRYIDHFQSIKSIYTEISLLCGFTDLKLKVIKIESGSFFDKFFGIEQVIDLFSILLKRTIDLIFKKYTFEGKMSTKAELIELIKSEIDLIGQAKQIGIEIDPQNTDLINKTIGTIAGDLLALVRTSSKIKIDDTEISLEESLRTKYIEQNQKKLIE